jgi:hypothetical protein
MTPIKDIDDYRNNIHTIFINFKSIPKHNIFQVIFKILQYCITINIPKNIKIKIILKNGFINYKLIENNFHYWDFADSPKVDEDMGLLYNLLSKLYKKLKIELKNIKYTKTNLYNSNNELKKLSHTTINGIKYIIRDRDEDSNFQEFILKSKLDKYNIFIDN